MNRFSRFGLDLKEVMSYDIRLHGRGFVLLEFYLASACGLTVTLLYLFYPGISQLYRLQALFWLGISVNFLTVLTLSIRLSKQGLTKETSMELSSTEITKLRRYTVLIGVFLIVPYATLGLHLRHRFVV